MSASLVASKAEAWVGKDFREGVPEQCMNFVRHVLGTANHPLTNVVTKEPVDKLSTGYALASSLAGRDLGHLETDISKLKRGAILVWNDTYEGPWPPNTITHVGIYVGNGYFVHRPTKSRPVERAHLSGFWREKFRCGLILDEKAKEKSQDPVPTQKASLKIAGHSGKLKAQMGNQPWFDLDSLNITLMATVDGAKVPRQVVGHSGKLRSRDGSGPWTEIDSVELRGDYQ